VSPDGKSLASGCLDGSIRFWDLSTGKNTATIEADRENAASIPFDVYCVAFSPDGKTLASSGDGGIIKLWDVATGRNIAQVKKTHQGWTVKCVAFSPDGKLLISGGVDNFIRFWDLSSIPAQDEQEKVGSQNGDCAKKLGRGGQRT